MIHPPEPLSDRWKEVLDLHDRKPPDIFEFNEAVRDTPYARAIRTDLSELGLSAVFCVSGVPTIAIRRVKIYDADEVQKIHAALWNQGLASVLVIISGDWVRVFSLAMNPIEAEKAHFEECCLIELIDATASALHLQSLVTSAETGRLWQEYSQFFKPKDRVDAVLLNNLEQAHDLLVGADLTTDQAQAVLIQTMFVAYLEDRGIILDDYFSQHDHGRPKSFAELLELANSTSINKLFADLHRDFNGDLFVAPCSFTSDEESIELSPAHMKILRRFRLGREHMASAGGQLRFWGYNFKYIPVELISAVYDRFLGKDTDARRRSGAFYTPMFLADNVVRMTWEQMSEGQRETGVLLDPACGSGVFLVRCFQRLCEHWYETRQQSKIRWDSLKTILSRVHGRDINAKAVRVAVFSLYLALLEQVSPPELRRLIERGRLLPPLWGTSLVWTSFFDEPAHEPRFDVIIGNPPWTSRKGLGRNAIDWSDERNYPTPGGEEAWSFVWNALEHLNSSGVFAFLLPAMGFLHNHAAATVSARNRLFAEARIYSVVNYADLRFQLFDGAIRPAALLVGKKNTAKLEDYEFDYWTPKSDLNLAIKRFVTISRADKHVLRASEVKKDSLLFKNRLWMREPEAKFFAYLSRLPRLRDLVHQYRRDARHRQEEFANSGSWAVGQGFQPYNEGRSTSKAVESDFVGTAPYLDIKAFTPLAIESSITASWRSSLLRRRGFESGFSGPRILIPRGVKSKSWRLQAAYVEKPLTFQHIIQAITVPPGEEDKAKLLTAILNSRLALWFAFHGTASFGAERPEVKSAELLSLPFPAPEDLEDVGRSYEARRRLIEIVDSALESDTPLLRSPDATSDLLQRIDKHTYDYFSLTEDEIVLVEDAVEYIFPAVQPSAGSYPQLWRATNDAEQKKYAEILKRRLVEWFGDDSSLGTRVVAQNTDFSIFEISLDAGPDHNDRLVNSREEFTRALARLSDSIGQPINANFAVIPDIRLFVGSNLYLIKPLQKRFWLQSTALADADSITIDLETLKRTNHQSETAL